MNVAATSFVAAIALLCTAPAIACHGLVAKDGWVREMPPGVTVAAGYLVLTNNGKTDQVIDAVRSPQFARGEIHEMSHEQGMMRMRPLPNLPVAAGATEALEPHGRHLMLFEPSLAIRDGAEIELELACGKDVTRIVLPVRRMDADGHGHEHGHE
jgi:periplasmic copper chaperone A